MRSARPRCLQSSLSSEPPDLRARNVQWASTARLCRTAGRLRSAMPLDEKVGGFGCGMGIPRVSVNEDERVATLDQQHDLPRELPRSSGAILSELLGQPAFRPRPIMLLIEGCHSLI